ncbi:MAG: hypothetical protein II073_07480 [Lachnospiraceae bacterium]|nr:hypothetical protein [Lachnospiraceae bacterium]
MGITTLLTATIGYIIKYFAYIAVILCAILLGKKWALKSAKSKVELEKEEKQ